MQRQRGSEPRSPVDRLPSSGTTQREGWISALFHGKRAIAAPLVFGAAIALVLTITSHWADAGIGLYAAPTALPEPISSSDSPAVQAAQVVVPAVPAIPTIAMALEATAVPSPVPTDIPTPMPTATPANLLPLSGPIAPKVVNVGPAPVRKPDTPDPNPTTQHVIVIDGASGAVLFQRNPNEPVAPASLTKIMTAIVGIEHGNLSDHVKLDVDARTMDGSSLMGLEPWFDVTFQDLLYGLMLPSGNDAALAIARYVAGNDDSFVQLMNDKAKWLGLRATHFVNPHGLDTSDHYSTPADMVAMARYAMQYPLFRQVVKTKLYDIRESNVSYTIANVNAILDAFPGADGVKTGYTDSAGRALVATAEKDGHRIYLAFMLSENGAASDGVLLLKWAFDSYIWQGGIETSHPESTVSANGQP